MEQWHLNISYSVLYQVEQNVSIWPFLRMTQSQSTMLQSMLFVFLPLWEALCYPWQITLLPDTCGDAHSPTAVIVCNSLVKALHLTDNPQVLFNTTYHKKVVIPIDRTSFEQLSVLQNVRTSLPRWHAQRNPLTHIQSPAPSQCTAHGQANSSQKSNKQHSHCTGLKAIPRSHIKGFVQGELLYHRRNSSQYRSISERLSPQLPGIRHVQSCSQADTPC